ncbi:hypothetical protein [Nocardia jiangxiensis]|uniref:hypothetical protein n=1 Tax=Nocardia jiangxiensis TaxID=282685 RepID=UPI0012F69775|nr:hypothetical protein [Nocardia jiangxiensis]
MNALLAAATTPTSGWQAREAMRIREMALPPDIRMSGQKRDLRDALLGRMLLRQRSAESSDGWTALRQLAERENRLTELNKRIKEIGAWMPDEHYEHCEKAAAALYSWIMTEKRNGR